MRCRREERPESKPLWWDPNVHSGEKLQWMVEGGKYKASFLLPDIDGTTESGGLLISEVSYTERLRR